MMTDRLEAVEQTVAKVKYWPNDVHTSTRV